jgi:hypothetical protein
MADLFDKTIERPSGAETCDLPTCGGHAVCDAPTTMGPWGYLCTEHFTLYGRPGIGFLFADSAAIFPEQTR